VEHCAFLDVHRDTVMACARTPDGVGGRNEEVEQFATTTSQLPWPLARPPSTYENVVSIGQMSCFYGAWSPFLA